MVVLGKKGSRLAGDGSVCLSERDWRQKCKPNAQVAQRNLVAIGEYAASVARLDLVIRLAWGEEDGGIVREGDWVGEAGSGKVVKRE